MYFSTVTIMVGIVLGILGILGILGMVLHGRGRSHGRSSASIMADPIAWRRVDGRLIRKIPLS